MIRPATAVDAMAIRAVQVQSWRETYRGIVPDAYLATLDTTPTEWQRNIAEGLGVLVAQDGPDIAGFVAFGPQRDPKLPFTGEIHAIYLLARLQKRGVGRALMHAAARGLHDRGHENASLWAMTENTSAFDFYLHLGARPVGTASFEVGGVTVAETALAWDDLATLLDRRHQA